MKKSGYYSSGQFAKISGVTKKTLRYYDEKNILVPSFLSESGARFYTEEDLGKMQQISLLKYLGFSLSDIREMMLKTTDLKQLGNFLQIQEKLVQDKIEQLKLVEETIADAYQKVNTEQKIDWSHMLEVTKLTTMENSLRNQYLNASNISARIQLHSLYSQNKTGWFPWVFWNLPLKENIRVLELGCGDGTLWKEKEIPAGAQITLTDISNGMLRDAKRNIGADNEQFTYRLCDCNAIMFEDNSFDLVIANHVLFYSDNIYDTCKEISRVLKPDGMLVAGTYGCGHMKEISQLVSCFDERIVLASNHLYECFGKENGKEILEKNFSGTEWIEYEDSLCVTEAEPLISYVLSCHGNQNQYIVDSYSDFKAYVKKRTENGFHITKEAGVFIAKNQK